MLHQSGRSTLARLLMSLVALMVLVAAGGCWGPQNLGRYNELAFGDTKRVRNPIFKTHDDWYRDLHYWVQGKVEEVEDFPGPAPEDLKPPAGDYILGANDLLRLIIEDLFRQNQPFFRELRISEEGIINLPYVKDVKAAGLTARGLEQRLIELFQPPNGPLKDPRITVSVVEYRNRMYSILGAVKMPAVNDLISSEMDLLQAVSRAGGVSPFAEEEGYIFRRLGSEELADLLVRAWAEETEAEKKATESPAPPPGEKGSEQPAAQKSPEASKPLTPEQELQAVAEGELSKVKSPETPAKPEQVAPRAPEVAPEEIAPQAPAPQPAEGAAAGWKFENGQWVRVQPAKAEEPQKPGEAKEPAEAKKPPTKTPQTFEELPPALRERLRRLGVVQAGEGLKRIIRINVPALLAGDPGQNVVLRNADVINIPEPPAGEWYIDGEVVRRGVYVLTGRKITLLQAVAAAGGLTQLAIPWRTELVRRVSNEAEEIIYVDLYKIARGEAPDFYLQPDDLIRVGTDQGAIFMAVLRNAFRATYGFGLVYDQNFADLYPWHGGVNPIF